MEYSARQSVKQPSRLQNYPVIPVSQRYTGLSEKERDEAFERDLKNLNEGCDQARS